MKKIVIIIASLFSFAFHKEALSWDNEITHRDISEIAAENSILSKTNGDYLKNLGIDNALDQYFLWGSTNNKIRDLLREGAFAEDAGSDIQGVKGEGWRWDMEIERFMIGGISVR